MNKTEIENEISDIKRMIESFKNLIEVNEKVIKSLEAEKEKFAFDRVEKGKNYYSIGESFAGKIEVCCGTERNTAGDIDHLENNNYFYTKERAEEVADKINFLLKLERLHDIYCPDYKPDWNDKNEEKLSVVFDSDKKKYAPYWNAVTNCTTVYFNSEEIIEKVCYVLNKEIENA